MSSSWANYNENKMWFKDVWINSNAHVRMVNLLAFQFKWMIQNNLMKEYLENEIKHKTKSFSS
jgi:hypothetical protein